MFQDFIRICFSVLIQYDTSGDFPLFKVVTSDEWFHFKVIKSFSVGDYMSVLSLEDEQ